MIKYICRRNCEHLAFFVVCYQLSNGSQGAKLLSSPSFYPGKSWRPLEAAEPEPPSPPCRAGPSRGPIGGERPPCGDTKGHIARPLRNDGRPPHPHSPASRRQNLVLCPNQSWGPLLQAGDGGGYPKGVLWEIRGVCGQWSRGRCSSCGGWATETTGSPAAALPSSKSQGQKQGGQREAAGQVCVSARVARTLLWRSHHGVPLQSAHQGATDAQRDPAEGHQRHQHQPRVWPAARSL